MSHCERLDARVLLAGYLIDEAWANKVLTDPPYASDLQPVGITRDGSLITSAPNWYDNHIKKYAADGTPDKTFDIRLGPLSDTALDVADRVVAAYNLRKPAEPVKGIELRRYTAAGALDITFNGDGVARLPTPAGSRARDVTVAAIATDSNGGALALLDTATGSQVIKLTPRGKLDTTFGNNGFTAVGAAGDYFASDLQIIGQHIYATLRAAATGEGGVQIVTLTPQGTIDTHYGNAGRFTLPQLFAKYFDHTPLTALDAQGRVYVSVFEQIPDGNEAPRAVPTGVVIHSVARFLPSGTLDTSFGKKGFAALRSPGGVAFDQMTGLTIDPQGRIWVADQYYSVARLTPQGTPDVTFDFDGYFDRYCYRPALLPVGDDLIQLDSNGEPQKLVTGRTPVSLDSDGVLQIGVGSNGANVRVTEQANRIFVQVDAFAPISVRKSAVKSVNIRLSDGTDQFFYDSTKSATIDALGGNDFLKLPRGAHIVDTGLGDDTVSCGSDTDYVTNDNGHDIIDLGMGKGRVDSYGISSASDESALYFASADVYAGPAGDKTVSIHTGQSNDYVNIRGGRAYVVDDGGVNHIGVASELGATITLGTATLADNPITRNFVDTNDGNDTIHATGGDNYIRTGYGDDVIDNLSGTGTIDAGSGNDSVRGGASGETLLGGKGNDTLRGNGGNDYLFGGDGDDLLFGNDGADTLDGGNGNDRANADADDLVERIETRIS